MSFILVLIFLCLPIIGFLTAITDIYSYSIPNSFSVVLIIGFYVFALLNPIYNSELIYDNTLVALYVFVATFILFAINIFGGGDAKILTAISLWVGQQDILSYIMVLSITGGLLSIILYVWRKTKPFELYSRFQPLKSLYFGCIDDAGNIEVPSKRAVPYGVAISISLFIVLPQTMLVKSLNLSTMIS